MRGLLSLLLGIFIFVCFFPVFLYIGGFIILFLLLTIGIGILRGGYFKVYTGDSYGRRHKNNEDAEPERVVYKIYTEENEYTQNSARTNQSSDGFEDEGEVIELPASALRKADETNDSDDNR